MPGLYDSYRLSNSSVVPLFTGTTAPEALQVGQYLQGQYDMARSGADDVSAASDNILSTDNPNDIALKNEVRNKIATDINNYASQRDWENRVEDVRKLGRYYASRSAELAAPVKAMQDYQKQLEDDKIGLTPFQKQVMMMRSKEAYGGLKKDNMGRFTGAFRGIDPAKNMDLTKWGDDVLKDTKEFKNADKIEYSDGQGYLVTRGNKTTIISEQRVQQILGSALQLDTNVQAFLNMEGDNAGFIASKTPLANIPDKTVSGVPSTLKLQAEQLSTQLGIPAQQAYGMLVREAHINGLKNNLSNYVQNKYAFTQTEREQGLSSDATWIHGQKEKAKNGLFGDAVTGTGIDLNKFGSPGDITGSIKTATESIENEQAKVEATKNTIARQILTDYYKGKTDFSPQLIRQQAAKLTPEQISKYFITYDRAGYGAFQASEAAVKGGQSQLNELNNVKDAAMDLSVRERFPGQTYAKMKNNATADFQNHIVSSKSEIFLRDGNKINAQTAKNYEFMNGSSDELEIRDKRTGKTYHIQKDDPTNPYHTSISVKSAMHNGADVTEAILKGVDGYFSDEKLDKISDRFKKLNWKDKWEQAATNIRSNSVWMPLLNKTTPDGEITKAGAYASRVEGILRAGSGALKVKDADLSNFSNSDTDEMRARISAGKFEVLGVGKTGSSGQMSVQLSVDTDVNEKDPAKRYKKIVVDVDSNMANKLSKAAIEAGQRDNDMRSIQVGLALKPGSGYEQVISTGSTGRLRIKDRDGNPLYEIVPNISGQSNDALGYKMYELNKNGEYIKESATFNDAFDLGTAIDQTRASGNVIEKF